MKLPPQIELRARCEGVSDLSDIIFRLQITAGYKNPYSIYFPKTDPTGRALLNAEEIEGQFTDHWEMAGMDYNGSLEDANELVTIHLWDPSPLRENYEELLSWPLFTHDQNKWRTRREKLDYFASCRNEWFTFGGISVNLPETTLLYVTLQRAVAPGGEDSAKLNGEKLNQPPTA